MIGKSFIILCAFVLTRGQNVVTKRNGCPVDVINDALFPHENCNQYYQCVRGQLLIRDCPINLFYNPYTQQCDWSENVNCKERDVPDTDSSDVNDVNSDPSAALAICAADGSENVLIAHENCNNFYKCFNGRPVEFKCFGNLRYNPINEICDWPENVDCGERTIEEGSGGSDNDGTQDNNNNDSAGNDVPSEAPAICAAAKSDGTLVAHENCYQFYKCFEGKPIAFLCPGTLLYDPTKEYCDCHDNVICGDRIVPGDNSDKTEDNNSGNDDPSEAPKICAVNDSDGVLVAHEKCNKFYKCHYGKPIPFSCPASLLYNPNTEQCDWPENVDCGDRMIPDGNNGNEENDTGNGNGDNGSDENDNGDSGNGDNGSSCNCNPGEAPTICEADGSDGVLVAHEKCNKFYICDGRRPTTMRCPNNLLFNPYTEQCDWSDNVDCGDRIIPDGDNGNGENDNGSEDNGNGDDGSGDNGNGDNGNGDNDNGENGNDENDTGDSGNGDNGSSCNCNPGEAPTICEADGSDGVLVAHEKCNKFYICDGGRPTTMRCPNSLLYNPYTEQCDWSHNVDCGDRIIPDGDNGNGENGNGSEDNGNGDDGSSDNGNDDNENGDNGNGDNDSSCNCNPGEAPAICEADGSEGVFVAHEKCNKFYVCVGGRPTTMKCPNNLLFNPYTEQCDWSDNVDCGDRIMPDEDNGNGENDNGSGDNGNGDDGSGDNGNGDDGNGDDGNGDNGSSCNCNPGEAPAICEADGSEGVFVAHERCNKFYVCVGGRPITMRCPNNLLFNPYTEQCDWSDNVDCGDRIIPDGDHGNGDNDNGSEDNGNSDDGSGDNGNGDSGSSCNCNPGEAPAICEADGSEGVFVAHEKCNKFYVCVGGRPTAMRCPNNLLFNPYTEQCDWSDNVDCGDRIIPDGDNGNGENDNGSDDNGTGDDGSGDNGNGDNGNGDNGNGDSGSSCNCNPGEAPAICEADGSEGVFVAHEKCNKFYVCVGGRPTTMRCPNNLLFNPYTEQCDWSDNVDCGDRIIPDGDNGNGDNDNGIEDNGNGDDSSGDNGNGDNGNGDNGSSCNCNPGEAPAICEAEGSEGVFVAHEKCNKFYVCVGGRPTTMRCPNNLLYNPYTEQCDWSDNVDCGDRIIPDGDNGNEDNDNGSEDNGNGDDGSGDSGNGDNGNGDNGSSCNCDPGEAPAICEADGSEGVFVAHEKCNKFYVCVGGRPTTMRCPNNLLFNPYTKQCDWSDNVDCGDRIIPDGDNGNGENDNGSEDNGNGDDGSGDNGNGDNGNGDNGNGGNDNGDDGSSCNCNPGEAPAICEADGSEGIFVAHEKCNKFYVCVGGRPTTMRCPNNLLFNPYTEQCDWSDNVDCGDRIIPDGDNGNGDNDNGSEDNGNGDDGSGDNGNGDNGNGDNGNGDNGSSCNCNPGEAPAICEADGSEGVFVAHEKCNKFYICVGGRPTTMRCPNNLLYNPYTEQCDWSDNVDCGDRIISDGDNGNEDNDNGSEDNGNGDDGSGDSGNGDNGNGDNGSSCNCDPGEAPAICEADGSEGVFVAHEKCNKFYVCVDGRPTTMRCPNNLLFNPYTKQCDWSDNVDCGDRIIPDGDNGNGENDNGSEDNGNGDDGSGDNGNGDNGNGDNGNGGNGNGDDGSSCNCNPSEAPAICEADGSEGIFVAHEKCNKFYVCVGGRPTTMRCPNNLLFNPYTEQCDWSDNVDCGDRIIPDGDNGNGDNDNGSEDNGNGDDGSGDNGNGDNGNGDNGNGDNGSSCNCDPGEAPAICEADGSEGVFVAHEKCNKFYVCVDGRPTTMRCPNNLLFNPYTKQCDWSDNVDCGDRIIPDGDNGNGENDNGSEDNGNGDDGSGDNGNGDNGNGDNGNGGNGNGDDGSSCNCNPSEAPAICEADGSEGIFVAHEKCNKFYVCVGGRPTTMRCPNNLLYNPYTEQCDWSDNVDCGDRIIPDGDNGNGDNDNGSEDNGNGDDGSGDSGNGDNGNGDNGSSCNCNPGEAPAICEADGSEGVFVAHEKCNKFYVCVGGRPTTLRCPNNLLFNPYTEQCDWSDNVDCGDRIIPDGDNGNGDNDNGSEDNGNGDDGSGDSGNGDNGNGDNGSSCNCNPGEAPAICEADGSEGVFVAHEKCNKFYVCVGGRPTTLRCPNNLLFNPYTEQCDWSDNVDCGDRIIPDGDIGNGENDNGSEDNGNGDDGSGDNGNGDNGIGDNGNGGNGNGDDGSSCNCNPGEAPAICEADGSEGVFVAHEKCNKFYVCVGGRPTAMRCPNNLLFNPYTEQCDWSDNVDCGDRIIPDGDNGNGENDNGSDDNGTGDDGSGDNGNGDNGNGDNGNGDNGSSCNCNPGEAPAICEADGSEGVFVAHEKCNKFYVCIGGRPTTLRCPNNLLFNPYTEQCDWSDNVDCGDRIIPDGDNGNGENDNGSEDNENDDDGGGDNGNGDNGNGDNSNGDNGNGDNGNGENGNGGNGNGDDGSSCNCNPGEAPAICEADGSEGVFVAHEKCNKFYVCVGGRPTTMRCPSNLFYNPYTEQCDWSANVDCGDRIIPDGDSGNGDSGDNENGSDDSGNGDNGSGDNGSGGNCNPAEAPAICAADGSEGVFVAHEKCNKFYVCVGGRPSTIRCPGTLLYNPHLEQCDWPENVECDDRIIPDGDSGTGDGEDNENGSDDNGNGDNGSGDNGSGGNCNPAEAPAICAADGSEGVFVAHEKCNKFYVCVGRRPTTIRCPGTLLYNPRLEQCDWPENVECDDRIIPDGDSGTGDGEDNENGSDDSGNGDNGSGGNCDPAEAPAICAADGSEGVFVAHEKCNKFYVCVGGRPTTIRCPGTLLYNPRLEQCDWPENVECDDRIIPDGDSGTGDGEDNENGSDDSGNGDNGSGDNGSGGNCNPAEAPAICAADGSEGVFVAHEKCNKFYVCVGGRPTTIRCPGTLLYNPRLEQCDWPENVECDDRIIPDGDSGTGDGEDNENGSDDSGNGDNGSGDNGSGGNCDPAEAPAICAADGSEGVFVAHEKCNKFYVCVGGRPTTIRCPGTLLYNPHLEQCDWPENVECDGRIIPDGDSGTGDGEDNENGGDDSGNGDNGSGDNGSGVNCNPAEAPAICAADGSEGIFVAHVKCNKFYVCVGGRPTTMRCPGTLLYNPRLEECDWPENVECDDRIIPDGDSGNGDSGDNENGSDDSGNGDNDSGDNGSGGNCNPAEAPAICAADGSEGVFVAHEKCNKFYVCVGGRPTTIRCPGTLLYNPRLEQCDWPENVECDDRIIPDGDSGNGDSGDNENGNDDNGSGDNGSEGNCNPAEAPAICAADGSEGVFVAHEKCNKFYVCVGGRPTTIRCPGTLLYNPRLEQCDWPENVECDGRIIPDGDSGTGDGEDNENGGDDSGNGDNGSGDNGSGGNCNPAEAPTICAADGSEGVFVAHEKCNKFYVCVGGRPTTIRCPGTLLYNPRLEQCDWPENVECDDRIIPDGDSGNGDSGDNENGNDDNGSGDNGSGGNCNPAEAPAICAADGSEGVFVAHEKCNKFYVCVGGRPTTIRCPGTLLYNPRLELCDWPENVECDDRIIPDGDSGNGDSGDNENGSGDNGNGDNGSGDNGSGGNCNPAEAPTICGADGSEGIFVAHEKCNKFYVCVGGKPATIRCPGMLLYNPRLEQCDWAENVECGDRMIPDGDNENESDDNGNVDDGNGDNGNICNCSPGEAPAICVANGSDGVLVAHENCNKFYSCADGKPIPLSCPGNLLYNPYNEQCDWPEFVNCGDRIIPDGDNGSDENDNGIGDSGNGDVGNVDNGSGDNCDPAEAPVICATDGSEGVLVAHENCNQFYVCLQGKPFVIDCPLNLLYNYSTKQCDWPENVKCGARNIFDPDKDHNDHGGDDNADNDASGIEEVIKICSSSDSDGFLAPHENCNKFYMCLEHKPAELTCPSSLLYDPISKQCDWPENVICGDRIMPSSVSINKHLSNRRALRL